MFPSLFFQNSWCKPISLFLNLTRKTYKPSVTWMFWRNNWNFILIYDLYHENKSFIWTYFFISLFGLTKFLKSYVSSIFSRQCEISSQSSKVEIQKIVTTQNKQKILTKIRFDSKISNDFVKNWFFFVFAFLTSFFKRSNISWIFFFWFKI